MQRQQPPFEATGQPTATPEIPGSPITDPELIIVCTEMLETTDVVATKLADLGRPPTKTTDSVEVTSQKVNGLLQEMVGEDKLPLVSQMSDLFWGLNRKMGRDSVFSSQLSKGVGAHVFKGDVDYGRGFIRSAHGAFVPKSKKLIEFWQDSNVTLSPEQVSRLDIEIIDPILKVSGLAKAFDETTVKPGLKQIDHLLTRCADLDPATSLQTAKFLVFNGIVESFKQPTIKVASIKIFEDNEESQKELTESELTPYYTSTKFLEDLEDGNYNGVSRYLSLLTNYGTKGRFFRIPGREFKQEMKRLIKLANLYSDLGDASELLVQIPEKENQLRAVANGLRALPMFWYLTQ